MSSQLQSKAHFEATSLGLLYRQFTKPKAISGNVELTSQVAIVTGSNVGLGLEASRQLLQLGLSHLVMGVRSQAKGDAAANGLRKEFPNATISVWVIDLESYDSVRAFANQCTTLPRIDIAILNAGLIQMSFTTIAATGHETALQVNYLSTALLAVLLLPLLKVKGKSNSGRKPPVISIVTSDIVYSASIDPKRPLLAQVDESKGYSAMDWYAKSKLLLTLFTVKLAESVSSEDVIINLVNPGMTKGTAFGSDAPAFVVFIFRLLQGLLARSVQTGATTYIDAVVARGEESHGSLISEWAIKP